MLYWVLKKGVLGPVLNGVYKPWVEGLEHVPETGGAIFASNHLFHAPNGVKPSFYRIRLRG